MNDLRALILDELGAASAGAPVAGGAHGLPDWITAPRLVYLADGSRAWVDPEGRAHRDDGPAIELRPGADLPALLDGSGVDIRLPHEVEELLVRGLEEPATIWAQHGVIHRTSGPALVSESHELWIRRGKLHSAAGSDPAVFAVREAFVSALERGDECTTAAIVLAWARQGGSPELPGGIVTVRMRADAGSTLRLLLGPAWAAQLEPIIQAVNMDLGDVRVWDYAFDVLFNAADIDTLPPDTVWDTVSDALMSRALR